MEVISKGIDLRRREIEEKIKKNLDTDLINYPVNAALADALRFHAACSAVTGFEVAKESVSEVENPGVVKLNNTLEKLGITLKAEAKAPEIQKKEEPGK
jgi:hypothetical protein